MVIASLVRNLWGLLPKLYKKPLESIDTRGFFTTALWLFRLLIIYLECFSLAKNLLGRKFCKLLIYRGIDS